MLQLPVVAAVSGIATQIALSPIPEVNTVRFVAVYAAADVALFLYLLKSAVTSTSLGAVIPPLLQLFQLNFIYIVTLIASTIIHRLYFHPLSSFPGPKVCAITGLYQTWLTNKGKFGLYVKEQHRKYGDFVRIAPNELAINNIEALQLQLRKPYNIRGPWNEFAKGLSGGVSLVTSRDSAQHKRFRAIWDKAFRTTAITAYFPRVQTHVEKFVNVLEKTEGRMVDCVPLIQSLTFDIMADLGFGVDQGMQDNGDTSFMDQLRVYSRKAAVFGTMRNFCELAPYLPRPKDTTNFAQRAKAMYDRRLAMGTTREDVFSHLMGEADDGYKFSPVELSLNSRLLIIAGSDTTAGVLINIFRELARSPPLQQKLYNEVDDTAKRFGTLDCHNTAKNMPLLQGVIDEALRRWNPVPNGAAYQTGPAGATVAGRFIPPNTPFRISHLSMMTDPRYFPDGERFWPERWTEHRQEGVKDVRAFIPFSYGMHSCVGKQLAHSEMRLVLAQTVLRTEIVMGESYDEKLWQEDWKDFFLLEVGPTPLRFKPRI